MTPLERLSTLQSSFPGFAQFWERDDNYHRDGNEWSQHGLWACFSEFVARGHVDLTAEPIRELFRAIEEIVSSDPQDADSEANAICTCFLENIAGTTIGDEVRKLMGPGSRNYLDHWSHS